MNRRSFVRGLSVASLCGNALASGVASSVAGSTPPGKAEAPLRLGIIGAGSRGKELIRNFLRVPGVSVVAAADVYQPRFQQLDALCGYRVAPHEDFRALLDRRDLDAIVVATPLSLHGEHVVAALKSGRPVYGEKTMAFSSTQAREIVEATASGKQIYQVGHQYRYAPWIQTAVEMVHKGEIGEVTHIYGYWHRNSDWRRPVPNPSLERLINWRLYNEYSLGLLSELGSHHIDIANWVFGEAPQAAFASGSTGVYRDGRENDDNVQAIFSYSKGRRFIFSALTDNAKQGNQLWLYGTRGSLSITLEDAEFFYEPHRENPAAGSEKARAEGIATGASYRSAGEMPYRGPGRKLKIPVREDPTAIACRAFTECVRQGRKPIADVQVGLRSASAVITANRALGEKRELPVVL